MEEREGRLAQGGKKVLWLSPLCVKGRSHTPKGNYSFELSLG